MNDITTIPENQTASIVATEGDNFCLSASSPSEMVQCHHSAIAWAKDKIKLMRGQAEELRLAFNHAVKRKWAAETLKRHWNLAKERVVYYEKMLAAFEAGYYIIPNFPVTLFAIRTDKPKPKRMWARLRYMNGKNWEQKSAILPAGEGTYENPQPVVEKDWGSQQTDEQKRTTSMFSATEWGKLDFPANMARVHVMEAATCAMDKKIFDEIGFLPEDYKRNPDPLLIGRIIDPRPNGYNQQKRVSFLLAWFIDTSTL